MENMKTEVRMKTILRLMPLCQGILMVSTSTDIWQNRKSEPNDNNRYADRCMMPGAVGQELTTETGIKRQPHRIPRESLHDNSMRPLAVQAQVKTPNNSNSSNFYDAMMLSEAENRERRLPVV